MKTATVVGRGFPVILSLVTALPPLATDMALPGVIPIAGDLGVSTSDVGLTLSSFMVGFALGPLVFGPLSDRLGRKPVLLAAMSLYIVAGLACAWAGTLSSLIAWRLLQGFGAGASWPVALACVRDVYEGDRARATMSYINAMSMIAPLIAPALGAAAIAFLGWRGIYLFLAGVGIAAFLLVGLFQRETVRGSDTPLSIRGIASGYLRVLRHPVCVAGALVNAFGFGALFSYITGSPMILMEVFSLSAAAYALSFAISTAGILSGTILNGAASNRGVPGTRLIAIGATLQVTTAAAFLLGALTGTLSPVVVVALAGMHLFGFGLVAPNVAQMALRPIPDIAGTGAAVLTALQLAFGALFGALVSALYDGQTATSTAAMMTVGAMASFVAYRFLARSLSAVVVAATG